VLALAFPVTLAAMASARSGDLWHLQLLLVEDNPYEPI
jgi:hypothetical protein